MDRIIRVLRVVAAPMVKKTVNLDFFQNINFVSIEYTFQILQLEYSVVMHIITFEPC